MNKGTEKEALEYIQTKNLTFGEALWKTMDSKGMSVKELSDKCYLSTAQIHRYMQGEYRFPKFGAIMSFCVAMNLGVDLSMELMRLAGFNRMVTETYWHKRCQFMIKHASEWTMEDLNEYIGTLNEACGVETFEYFPNERSYQRHLKDVQEG